MPEIPERDAGRIRDRAIARSVVGGAAMQGVIVLSALLALPFVARGLTPPEFGVLTTLSGLLGVLAFADLGVGGALTTRVAHLHASGDPASGRIATSTALVAASLAAMMVLIVVGGSAWVLPWPTLLGANELPDHEVRTAVVVTAGAVALGVVGSLGQRVLYGLHLGGRANAWLVAGALVSGIVTTLAAVRGAGLVVLVATSLVVPPVVSLVCTAWTLVRDAPHLRPQRSAVAASEWRWLRAQSGWFFAIAFAGAVAFQTDALIVAAILGASSAGIYGVVARLFGVVAQVAYPGLLQLWPAFTDAHVRGDLDWIRSRLTRALVGTGAFAMAAGALLVAVGPELIRWLLVETLVPPRVLLVGFALWTAFSLMNAAVYLMFNAVGLVNVHGIVAVAVAAVNLPTSWFLTDAVGLSGPVWGSLIASVCCGLVPALVFGSRVLRGEVKVATVPDGE